MQPGIDPIRIAEAAHVTPSEDERLLQRVLCSVDVAEDAVRDSEESINTPLNQAYKSVAVTALSTLDEVSIHR